MTVLDSSVVFDFLVSDDPPTLDALLGTGREAAAPDLLVFEVLAALRRHVLAGGLDPQRAAAAVHDLGDLAIELFPTLSLRDRAWALRNNLTAADALFVALAESLDEPLATRDAGLSRAASTHSDVEVVHL